MPCQTGTLTVSIKAQLTGVSGAGASLIGQGHEHLAKVCEQLYQHLHVKSVGACDSSRYLLDSAIYSAI